MESNNITIPSTFGGTADSFFKVNFRQKFDVTPVVFALATIDGGDPATLRIRNVLINDGPTGSFEITIVEPPGNDGPHVSMSVHYFAIEPGSFTLDDGTLIEAGSLNSSAVQHGNNVAGAESWDSIVFPNAFTTAPAFIAQIQTTANESGSPRPPAGPSTPWLTTAVDNLTATGVDIALERSDVNNGSISVAETIGYVAVDTGTGSFIDVNGSPVNLLGLVTGNSFDGWDNGCDAVPFPGNPFSVSPLVMATKISHRSASDSDGGWLRRCSLNAGSIGLTVDEDRDNDTERRHTPAEAAGILAFSQGFVFDSTVTPPSPDPNWKIEVGEISLPAAAAGDTNFTNISFQQRYDDIPLVFVLPSNENPDPAALRVRNITATGFDIAQVEPPNNFGGSNSQPPATIHYLVVEPGIHQLPGGINVDAGSITTQAFQNKLIGSSSWETISYRTGFNNPPVILAQVQTMANETGNPPGAPSIPWLGTTIRNVTNGSFQIALGRGEVTAGTINADESIAYLAITSNVQSSLLDSSNNPVLFQTIRSADNINHNCTRVNFNRSYPAPPIVLASLNKRDGVDGGWVRRCLIDTTRVNLRVDEDQSNDSDRAHTTELAGLVVFERSFNTQLGCGPIPGTYPLYSGGTLDVDNNVTMNTLSPDVPTGTSPNSVTIDNTRINISQLLPSLEPDNFPGNSSTDDANEGNAPFDSNVKSDYKNITIDNNANVNFTGADPFNINTLTVENGSTINLASGTYYIDKLDLKKDAILNIINPSVRLHIGTEFKVDGNNVAVNSSGSVAGLVVFLHQNARFKSEKNNFNFTGVVYGPDSDEVEIKNATFHGAIITGGDIQLQNTDFIYTTEDQTAVANISTCEPTASSFSHFTITHDNFGINCLAEPGITITAIGSDGNPIDASGLQITLDTQSASAANSIWTKTSPDGIFDPTTATDNIAYYSFTAGQTQATFSLLHQQGDASLNLVTYLTNNPATKYADPEGNLLFSANGFTITTSPLANPFNGILPPVAGQIAGTDVPLYVTAYGVTNDDSTCGVIESYEGNKPLQFWFDYNNPNRDSGRNPSVNTASIPDNGVSNPLTLPGGINFTAGRAYIDATSQVSTKYKDVGKISFSIGDASITNDPELPTGISGSTELTFVPADIVITEVKKPDGSDNHLNVLASAAEPSILKAGNPFAVKFQVRDAEGSLTPNFGYENSPELIEIISSSIVAPAPVDGGRNGSMDDGAIVNKSSYGKLDYDGVSALADGEFLGTVFSFDEVGIIQLQASINDNDAIDDNDYLGALMADGTTSLSVVGSPSTNVGRFVPDRFIVTDNAPNLANSCGSFSYMDQAINLTADPVITLTAVAENGAATLNYDRGSFWRYTADLANRSYSNNAMTPATLDAPVDAMNVNVSGNNDGNGVAALTISNENILYQRPSDPRDTANAGANPAIPFNGDINLDLSIADVSDADGVCYDENNDGICKPYSIANIDNTEVRFGRLNIGGGFGSELIDLQLPVTIQYYENATNDFAPVVDDSCTVLTDTVNGVLATTYGHFLLDDASAYTGNLNPTETIPSLSAFTGGRATLSLSASGSTAGVANTGSVLIQVLLNNASIPLIQPWLQYDWDGDGNHDNDPTAVATFGIYHGNDSTIYLRELY